LAASVCALRGRRDLLASWPIASQRELIESLVRSVPVVDGVTKRREPTVDALALDEYLRVLEQVQTALSAEAMRS
jgi:hypothetical protein